MGFDELNVIKPPQENSGGGGGGIGGGVGGDLGLDINSIWTDAMIASADAKAKQIAENIINSLKPIKDAIGQINFEPLVLRIFEYRLRTCLHAVVRGCSGYG